MYKIKLSILLSSLVFLVLSCTSTKNIQNKNFYYTYGVDYISGGQDSFILKNILTQKLLVNNIYSEHSSYRLRVSPSIGDKYLSTSVNKISTRQSKVIDINLELYDENRKCSIMDTRYKKGQTYIIADSKAELSNIAATEEIVFVNIGNITDLIVDDLLSLGSRECLKKKKLKECDKKSKTNICNKGITGMQLKKPKRSSEIE